MEAGTNRAYIEAKVDILAHPGLITEADARLAAKNGVHLEITTRAGHSISNGHVAALGKRCGALLLLNTDSHAPGDLASAERALKVALGAGLTEDDFKKMQDNAHAIIKKIRV